MPDEKRYLLHYSDYFTKNAPKSSLGVLAIFFVGMLAGMIATDVLDFAQLKVDFIYASANGMSAGLLAISVPALISAAVIKVIKRRLYLKHILMALIIGSIAYSFFIIINSIIYIFLQNAILAYIIILLGNASLFGYWFIISRFLTGSKRDAAVVGAIQPTLNFLFYLPLSRYFIYLNLPFWPAAVKLYAGMFIFLLVGYIFLYVVDKPAKKSLNVSGVEIFTVMVNQWLYNIGTLDLSLGAGKRTDIKVRLLVLKSKKGIKSIFVEPDIHYGPFAGTGGASATEFLGGFISKKYNASPFVLHGAVNVKLNPISTNEIKMIGKELEKNIEEMKESEYRRADGGIGFGVEEPCKAIALKINDVKLITLTKAPKVTEDIDYNVGEELAKASGKNTIIIDAHNSRFESASRDELKGVYEGSRYVELYKRAIAKALKDIKNKRLEFGSASFKLSSLLKNKHDIGNGYSSIGVFKFGNERFAMIYFDANNMLPSLRNAIVGYVSRKYKMRCEVYTTDTHSVNSLARPFTNVLGRETKIKELIPIVDIMLQNALNNMEEVESAYKEFIIHNFAVWGEDAEKNILETSREIMKRIKHIIPMIIAAGFVIAAWVIYFI